jgi:hypothetical protein
VGSLLEVGGDPGLDGPGEQAARPSSRDVGQGIVTRTRWTADRQGSRLIPGGVHLGHFGGLVVLRFTKGAPASSSPDPQLSVIAHVEELQDGKPAAMAFLLRSNASSFAAYDEHGQI